MRRTRTYLIAISVLAVLAGCGGGSSKPAAAPAPPKTLAPTTVHAAGGTQATLLAAVEQTTAAKTARVELDETVTGEENVTITGGGAVNFAAKSAQLQVEADTGTGAQGIELRVVNGRAFVRDTSAGSEWTSVAADDSMTVSSGANDPGQYLDFLRGVSNDVRIVGHERVRDAETTHYAATIDLSRVLGSPVSGAVAKLFNGDASQVPVQAWVDDDGNVRKIVLVLKLKGDEPVAIKATVEFYDFGVPVDVQAPANAVDAQGRAQDRGAQSDLRNALTAEKVIYTDTQQYSASPVDLKPVEDSLDWGGKLHVVVGNVQPNDHGAICIEEASKSGTTFAIADVSSGALAGTYYGTKGCPAVATPEALSALGASW